MQKKRSKPKQIVLESESEEDFEEVREGVLKTEYGYEIELLRGHGHTLGETVLFQIGASVAGTVNGDKLSKIVEKTLSKESANQKDQIQTRKG